MSKEYRSLYAGLVDHPKFLPLSADAKLVFFMAKLQLGASGIGVLYSGTLAGQIGSSWDTARVDASLDELCAGGERAWLDREQNVVWIRKGLENEPHLKLKRDTHRASICNHLATLPKLAICNRFAEHYGLPIPHPDLRVSPTLEATLADSLTATGRAVERNSGREADKESQSVSPAREGKTDDGRTRAIFEMMAQVEDYAADNLAGRERVRFVASARMIVQGEDRVAWDDPRGNAAPWEERPRLLLLALAKLEAGESESLRGAIKYVVAQQLDPDRVRTARTSKAEPKRDLSDTPDDEHLDIMRRVALPNVLRDIPDFKGGLPDPFYTVAVRREHYGLWDVVLRENGLLSIREAHERGEGWLDEVWWEWQQRKTA